MFFETYNIFMTERLRTSCSKVLQKREVLFSHVLYIPVASYIISRNAVRSLDSSQTEGTYTLRFINHVNTTISVSDLLIYKVVGSLSTTPFPFCPFKSSNVALL